MSPLGRLAFVGILVPFGDAAALGRETAALLSDERRRLAMRERAYAVGRSMIWPRIAEHYRAVFASARRSDLHQITARQEAVGPPRDHDASRAMPIGHFLSLCDHTGLLQLAMHCVPDRSHRHPGTRSLHAHFPHRCATPSHRRILLHEYSDAVEEASASCGASGEMR